MNKSITKYFTLIALLSFIIHHTLSATPLNKDPYYNAQFPDYINGVTNNFVYKKFSVKPQITGDAVVFRKNPITREIEVLMIKRANAPDMNAWATPGGIKDSEKDVDFILRELLEEAVGEYKHHYLENNILIREPLKAKENIALWDMRTPINPTVQAEALVVNPNFKILAGDDAKGAEFLSLQEIYDGKFGIAFRHIEWIGEAVEVLASKSDYTDDFEVFCTPEQKKKLQTVIDQSIDRNKGLAQLVNLKRQLDGQPLIKDEHGNPILPPFKKPKINEIDFWKENAVVISITAISTASFVIAANAIFKTKKGKHFNHPLTIED